MSTKPNDIQLYKTVVKQAKKKFLVWPSIYASSWVVREYKKQGGTYTGTKSTTVGLRQWFDEKWIDVCELPKEIPCGRPDVIGGAKKYPYCRPTKKFNKFTPKLASTLSEKQIRSRCRRKKSNPYERIKKEPQKKRKTRAKTHDLKKPSNRRISMKKKRNTRTKTHKPKKTSNRRISTKKKRKTGKKYGSK